MAYACAYAAIGDFYLAEDAAQEAFLTAWRKLDQLHQPEAFPGWFRRIVLTECNRLTRRKSLRTISLDDAGSVPAVCGSPKGSDSQTVIEKDELTTAVFTAINKLTVNERAIILLFYIREYSQSEISTFLGLPLTTVAKRLYSARLRLRGMIKGRFMTDLGTYRLSRNQTFAEKVKAGIYDEYVGQYKFELRPDLLVTIKREGERLIGEAAGQRNELVANGKSQSELLTREFDGRGKFLRNRRGRITHLVYYEFGCEMGRAEKIC